MLTRRRFLQTLGLGCFAAGGSAGYARFVEPYWLWVDRQEVPIDGLREPVKLLHLTDLHYSDEVSAEYISEAVQLGLAEEPDLICLTGDYVTAHRNEHLRKDYADLAAALRPLAEYAPTYASLGNHDLFPVTPVFRERQNAYLEELAPSGMRFLINEARNVVVGGQVLRVIGMGDLWAGQFGPITIWREGDDPEGTPPTIVLSHNPDTKETLAGYSRWDLMLSGHTHGGQVRVPILNWRPYTRVRDKSTVDGLYRYEGRWLYVGRGVGYYGVRFNCRPSVGLLTLVPA